MGLRELKAIERRKRIRKYIRKGLSQIEIAQKENVEYTTVSEDVAIIKSENAQRLLANKQLIDKDIKNTLKALERLNEIDEELWNIYYGTKKRKIKGTLGEQVIEEDYDPQTRLQALDKLRQNNTDKAKLLKLLNPTQINVENLVYVEKMVPVLVNKMINIVLEYVPKEKQVELLEKLKVIDMEGIENE